MRRFLLALALFAAAVMILRRFAGAFAPAPRSGARSGAAPAGRRGSTELVRDRVCNTFLPKDRAIAIHEAGETHWFCSEACRDRFHSGSSSEIDAA